MMKAMMTPVAGVGFLQWRDPTLPAAVAALMQEAVATGHLWAATFDHEWTTRPFVGDGEGLFLALADQDPVAMAVVSADPFTSDRDTGRLRYIYVRHDFRRRGIAEHLLRACLARGRDRWRHLRLQTDNDAAARLYESYGFVRSTGDARATHRLAY